MSYSDDQALDQINREAEERKAARLAARERQRADKMRERIQKSDLDGPNYGYKSSNSQSDNDCRDQSQQLKELEEKVKKSELRIDELEKERVYLRYQLDFDSDELIQLRERNIQIDRICKNLETETKKTKREKKDLEEQTTRLMKEIEKRDKLIEDNNLVLIQNGEELNSSRDNGGTLISAEAANILALGNGSLDDKIKSLAEERTSLKNEIKDLQQQLEEEKDKQRMNEKYNVPTQSNYSNGPDSDILLQQESQRQLTEYRFKIKKSEQEIATLQGNLSRMETQVKRYKTAAEDAEKNEEELKQDRRKLQRELREIQSKLEESEREKSNMSRRIERLRNSRVSSLQS
ncbi:DgyrCDS3919 [Dimorphilus gyrociliatus]|uniref:DgyrCDS3919 n=1 Tax=Dimorphilus gyrociliatus TaxID=2664684 RepID=A0A7I8VFD3_9ANNE|nr:DgyrCDS3919 [Dimorphilus gyrociliatus]